MSVSFGFYNSFEGDRTYDAIQMSSIFDGVISDGVFATVADGLAVTAVNGNRIGVKKGRAWFDHTWTYNDSLYPIDLGPSEILQDRIDAVVLEVNELIRTNRILVLEGEPSLDSPSNPELTNTSNVHQYPLAYIYRTGGSEEVIQADITNMIGTSACPFVTGVIDTIDIDILVAQWQSQYTSWFAGVQSDMEDYEDQFQEEAEEWFDNMKDQLTTDAAVNLQNQIGNLANLTTTAKNNLVAAVNEAASTGGGGSVTTEDVGQGQYEEPLIQIANGGTGARTNVAAILALSIYPVGSIYMSVNNVDPGLLFGGTWERIQDTFLLASGSTYAAGDTGGEAEHTLTTNEMPSHTHFERFASNYDNIGYYVSNYNTGGSINGVLQYGTRRDGIASADVRVTTASEGGGSSHNNMPPYIAVYVWKRVS